MPEIVLSSHHAKFIHASFGLRYPLANLGELRPRTRGGVARRLVEQPRTPLVLFLISFVNPPARP